MKKTVFIFFILLSFISCKDDVIPKPNAQLRLDYSTPVYEKLNTNHFNFQYNDIALVTSSKQNDYEIHYPKMKATVYLSYKPVNNDIDSLLHDAQKLTYDHAIKADEIITQPFINNDKKVYGMFSEVGGNAATNAQFYVTDSTKNFLYGSMYFYTKPNFDSILPAANYIKDDIRKIMETVTWK